MRPTLYRLALILALMMVAFSCRCSNDPTEPPIINSDNGGNPGKLDSDALLERAILATVKIFLINAQGKPFASCSGTVVDPAGYIVTDWHCVGVLENDQPQEGVQPGQLFHPQGWVVICPTLSPTEAPKPTYMAKTVAADIHNDIAIVKIFGTFNGNDINRPLPLPAGALPLVVEPIGDSSAVKIGSPVTAIGYPGLGGSLITVTHGTVAGFDDHNQDGQIDSFKTDTTMNHGNSGGLAVNDAGNQIGIPAWGNVAQGSPINGIWMIDLAKPLLVQARNGTWRPPVAGPARQQPLPQPEPQPAAPTQAAGGVIMRGQIIDADTQRGVPQALFVMLKPGVTANQWQATGYSTELVAAAGRTSQDGLFQTSPTLERGQTYTVVVAAEGYQPLVDTIELPGNVPDLLTMEPVPLQKR